jgi:hypothetical protein
MDRTLTVVADNKKIKHYNPEKGLKEFAVAEAAERHWKRAKDAEQLCTAIDRKIDAQADYVEWRDGVVVPSQKAGIGRGVDKRITDQKSALPAADPGSVTAHRWRKRFFIRGDGVWKRDDAKLAAAKEDARHCAIRICEQENMGIWIARFRRLVADVSPGLLSA